MASVSKAIAAHIILSGDDTYYYNLVVLTGVGSISRDGNNIVVSDIIVSVISDLLGRADDDFAGNDESANVNAFSYYKPNGAAPYDIDEFVGYNHAAKAPTYFAARPATDDNLIVRDGANYKLANIAAHLRRGEKLPIYLGSADAWTAIKVDFELYEYAGGIVGDLVDSTSITGQNVAQMRADTLVNSGTLTVPNATATYMLRIKPYYTHSGDHAIEDAYLATVITAYAIIPFVVDYYVGNWAAQEPINGASTCTVRMFNSASGVNAEQFDGDVKLTYSYYESPDGYPTLSNCIGEETISLAPGGSSSSGYTDVVFDLSPAVGVKDTGHNRWLKLEYRPTGGAWVTLFNHQY